MRDGRQEVGVRAGHDEEMFVGVARRHRTPWIDDHQPPAPFLEGAHTTRNIGRGQKTAVGYERIGAQHQPVIRAVDVGQRHRSTGAVHQRAGHLLGQLIHAAGRKYIATAQRRPKGPIVKEERYVVHVGIAEVGRQTVAPVLGDHPLDVFIDMRERLVPAYLFPARILDAAAPNHGPLDPVRIVVQVPQRQALRAQKTFTQRILFIPANAGDAVTGGFDFQAAGGFTQRTGAVVGFGFAHGATITRGDSFVEEMAWRTGKETACETLDGGHSHPSR